MKICTKCTIEKENSEFYSDKRKKDGLRSWCKLCQKEDNKKREFNYNETRKKYRIEHKEEYREKKKVYYIQNKNKVLLKNYDWRQTFKGRLASYIRAAKKRNIDWQLTDEEFKFFWDKNCYYCGDKILGVGIDRVDSLKGYTLENLVPCCYQCNICKMDYSLEEFKNKIKKIYNNLKL